MRLFGTRSGAREIEMLGREALYGKTICREFAGGYGEGVIPVPIPNTVVKPFSADGTWDEDPRESRTLPAINS